MYGHPTLGLSKIVIVFTDDICNGNEKQTQYVQDKMNGIIPNVNLDQRWFKDLNYYYIIYK